MRRFLDSSLLAGAALVALSAPALAAAQKAAAAAQPDPRIGVLEQELRDVQLQLGRDQGRAEPITDNSAARAGPEAQHLRPICRSSTTSSAPRPRPASPTAGSSFASADGAFTLALRSLVQFDVWLFRARASNPASVDLNSGTNFRRAQIGFQGTAWQRLVLQFHLRLRRQRRRKQRLYL